MIKAEVSLTVYAPIKVGVSTWREVERLIPAVELHTYTPRASIARQDGEVVIIFRERAPDDFRRLHPEALAVYQSETGLVFVLLRELEDYLKANRSEPAFRVALGRIIAHELQHVRHGKHHDEAGFFKPKLSRDDLLRRVQ